MSKLCLGYHILILNYELSSAYEMKVFNLQPDTKKMIRTGHVSHIGK
jgi:hypothetical protein